MPMASNLFQSLWTKVHRLRQESVPGDMGSRIDIHPTLAISSDFFRLLEKNDHPQVMHCALQYSTQVVYTSEVYGDAADSIIHESQFWSGQQMCTMTVQSHVVADPHGTWNSKELFEAWQNRMSMVLEAVDPVRGRVLVGWLYPWLRRVQTPMYWGAFGAIILPERRLIHNLLQGLTPPPPPSNTGESR